MTHNLSSSHSRVPEIVPLELGRPQEAAPSHATPTTFAGPDERQVRAHLDRILASPAFDASLRNRAFLRYVVDQTLSGHADYIKGYSVAQEVFQRDVNFDPQLDPVVRIEARRLRRSLELYYLTAGKRDVIRIELPKGGYVPTFAFNPWKARQAPAEDEPHRTLPQADCEAAPMLPVLLVRRFEIVAGDRPDCWARGVMDELVGRLLRYDGLAILADGGGTPLPDSTAARGADPHAPPSFLLTGSLHLSDGRLRTWVQLLEAASGRYLWVNCHDLAVGTRDGWSLQEEVAQGIAETIAGPDGALGKYVPR